MYYNYGNIHLSKKEFKNTIQYDNVDYLITPLNEQKKGSKGGNSNVFKLLNPQTDDEFIIKFSKYNVNKPNNPENIISRIARFSREVEALKLSDDLNTLSIFLKKPICEIII